MAKQSKKTVVVARHMGYYGDTPRPRGARFGLRKPGDFSEKWMVDPNDPKQAEEARLLMLEYKANHPERSSDVSDDVIMAEVAQSGGALAALDQKNKALQKQVAELQAQLAANTKSSSGGSEDDDDEKGSPEKGAPEKGAGEDGKEPAEGSGRDNTEAGGEAGTSIPRTRPTRRRRN